MDRKISIATCMIGLLTLNGCYLFQPLEEVGAVPSQPVATCTSDDGPCITPPETQEGYVNYQEVAADYRDYGERTPRDRRVVESGGPSNMAAAVPPTLEKEVTDYEEEIKTSSDDSDDTTQSASQEKNSDTSTSSNSDMDKLAPAGAHGDADGLEKDWVSEEVENYESDLDADKTKEKKELNLNLEDAEEDPVKDWLAEEGRTLKDLLLQWSNESGWRLIWKTNRNYTLNAGAMFRGRFADVSAALVRAFGRASPAPTATFYKGNRVLVIETMEDENAYE